MLALREKADSLGVVEVPEERVVDPKENEALRGSRTDESGLA